MVLVVIIIDENRVFDELQIHAFADSEAECLMPMPLGYERIVRVSSWLPECCFGEEQFNIRIPVEPTSDKKYGPCNQKRSKDFKYMGMCLLGRCVRCAGEYNLLRIIDRSVQL